MRAFLFVIFAVCCIIAWYFLALPTHLVLAKDLNGTYKDSPLHAWFDSLQSGKGLCCSFADGRTIDDPDIDTDEGHYLVRIDGNWIKVPDEALVTVPNKFGRPVVWPYMDGTVMKIRCFLPGAAG